jgi:hypothetical protein
MEKLFPTIAGPQLPAQWQSTPHGNVRGLAIAGIVTVFAGVGLLIGAQLVAHIEPDALWGMSTGGVITSCVGLGLVTASWVLPRIMRKQDRDRSSGVGDNSP